MSKSRTVWPQWSRWAAVPFSGITDGLSHTMMAAEKAVTTYRDLDQFQPLTFETAGWWVLGAESDTIFSTDSPPNAYKKVACGSDGRGVAAWVESASSLHPGGVNILMADGSARFVKESIQSWPIDPTSGVPLGAFGTQAPGVWQALGTRNGGEVLADTDF